MNDAKDIAKVAVSVILANGFVSNWHGLKVEI